jgi:hypothetical protein
MLAASYLCSLWFLASGLLGKLIETNVMTKTITLNLKQGEKNAYLDEGFASFALVKNDSILANQEVLVFPQYGYESDATSVFVDTELLQTESIGFFPMFEQGRAILLQLYPGSEVTETPPAFNCISFELGNGSYTNAKILPISFDSNISSDQFSSNPNFFKALTSEQLKHTLYGLEDKQIPTKIRASFSFFTFQPKDNTLFQVLCEIKESNSSQSQEKVDCRHVFSKLISPKGSLGSLQFTDMQVVDYTDNSLAVILYSSQIALVQFASDTLMADLKFYDIDKSYNFVRWFAGGWYGVSKQGGIDILIKLKLVSTNEFKSDPNLILMTDIFIPNEKRVTFNRIWTTSSLLVLQYMNTVNPGEFGVAVVYFSEPTFIPGTKYIRDASSENYDILDIQGRVLKQLNYPVQKGEFIQNCIESNGTLVMFGRRMMNILPVPVTLNIPKGKQILYQTNGNMNSTYNMTGSNIFYVLPTPSKKKTRSMTLLKDTLLLMDGSGDRIRRRARLQIQEVSITNPVVQLDTLEESILRAQAPLELDICYTYNMSACNMVHYKIGFTSTDKPVDYLILGALIGIGVILLITMILFIIKARKAIKGKKQLSTTMQKHQILLADEDDDSKHEALNFSGYQKKSGQGQ